MASSYLLDTNIISAILKHHEKVRERVRSTEHAGEEIFISTVRYTT